MPHPAWSSLYVHFLRFHNNKRTHRRVSYHWYSSCHETNNKSTHLNKCCTSSFNCWYNTHVTAGSAVDTNGNYRAKSNRDPYYCANRHSNGYSYATTTHSSPDHCTRANTSPNTTSTTKANPNPNTAAPNWYKR